MRTSFVRHLYFTVVTLITLGMMVGSLGYILYVGLDSLVFVRTTEERGYNVPPSLYLAKADGVTKIDTANCADTCVFSEEDKQMVTEWQQSYTQWKEQSRVSYDASSLVNSLSLFLVSAPLFFLHYRILKREYLALRDTENATGVFSIYYYIAALGTLVVSIVFASMLINTVLRTWVITDANKQYGNEIYPTSAIAIDTQDVNAIVTCADSCEFTDEQVQLAEEWKSDYEAGTKIQTAGNSWKSDFSRSIAGVLVTLPVFLYHWVFIRRESKKNKEEKIS